MNPRKVTMWALAALMVYFILAAPEQAADVTQNTFAGLRDAAQSGTQFLHTFSR
jgi:hypothetical protein